MGINARVAVHVAHCCIRHGCKYGQLDCPVTAGAHAQEVMCEHCDEELHDGGLDLAYAMNALWDKAFAAGREKGDEEGYERGRDVGYTDGWQVGSEAGRDQERTWG